MFQFANLLRTSNAERASRRHGSPHWAEQSGDAPQVQESEAGGDSYSDRVRRDLDEHMKRLTDLLDRVESIEFDSDSSNTAILPIEASSKLDDAVLPMPLPIESVPPGGSPTGGFQSLVSIPLSDQPEMAIIEGPWSENLSQSDPPMNLSIVATPPEANGDDPEIGPPVDQSEPIAPEIRLASGSVEQSTFPGSPVRLPGFVQDYGPTESASKFDDNPAEARAGIDELEEGGEGADGESSGITLKCEPTTPDCLHDPEYGSEPDSPSSTAGDRPAASGELPETPEQACEPGGYDTAGVHIMVVETPLPAWQSEGMSGPTSSSDAGDPVPDSGVSGPGWAIPASRTLRQDSSPVTQPYLASIPESASNARFLNLLALVGGLLTLVALIFVVGDVLRSM